MILNNLKAHISEGIKESCYKSDARLYKIANEVQNIGTFSYTPGVDVLDGLIKIVDKTIKEAQGIGCDLSVIIKGILIGSFRSVPFSAASAYDTLRILIKEVIQPVYKHKVDVKQAVEGLLAGIIIIANEHGLNIKEALTFAQEDILISANAIDAKFADDIKGAFPNLDEL